MGTLVLALIVSLWGLCLTQAWLKLETEAEFALLLMRLFFQSIRVVFIGVGVVKPQRMRKATTKIELDQDSALDSERNCETDVEC